MLEFEGVHLTSQYELFLPVCPVDEPGDPLAIGSFDLEFILAFYPVDVIPLDRDGAHPVRGKSQPATFELLDFSREAIAVVQPYDVRFVPGPGVTAEKKNGYCKKNAYIHETTCFICRFRSDFKG